MKVDLFEETKKKIRFAHPVVGIHVRRTDKVGHEARHHEVHEYMSRARAYYLLHYTHLKPEKRRVLFISDDSAVIQEANSLFGLNQNVSEKYDIIDSGNYKTAGVTASARRNLQSTIGIVIDILLLSETNFVVGTFSSQISRIAYELQQIHSFPGIASATTLMYDDWWYIGDPTLRSLDAIRDNFGSIYLPEEEYKNNNQKFEKLFS